MRATTEIPWTFLTWLANFKNVDLPIGDLAADALNDPKFPDVDDYEKIYSYLSSKGASSAAIETFKIVWDFYLTSS